MRGARCPYRGALRSRNTAALSANRAPLSTTAAAPMPMPTSLPTPSDGITRHRNRKVMEVDRVRMAAERQRWLENTLGFTEERAARYAAKGMPPCWAENLPTWRAWAMERFTISEEEAMKIARKDPAILGGKLEVPKGVADWLGSDKGPGFTPQEVKAVFFRAPALFTTNQSKMQETLDWMRSEDYLEGEDHGIAYVKGNPIILNASLHGRIRPRYDLAKKLGETVNLTYVYQNSNSQWAERLGISMDTQLEFERQGPDYLTARKTRELERRADWLRNTLGITKPGRVEEVLPKFSPGWERSVYNPSFST